MVDNMVGGVGGGVSVDMDLGHMMNLGVDLVTNETGLRNQVGLDSLDDTGSGDSNRSMDSMDLGDNSMGNSNWSSMGNSNWGSVSNSNWGSVGNSNWGSSYSRSSSIGQAMSSENTSVSSEETMSSVAQTMDTVSGEESSVAKNLGISISISHRGGHGGTGQGRKDNKEVHGAES